MTMNSSGPISLGGGTSGVSIAYELGRSPTAQISLNDTPVRQLSTQTTPGSNQVMPAYFWGQSYSVGQYWTFRFGSNRSMYAMAYSGSKYIMGGQQSVCYESADGITWTSATALQTAVGSYAPQTMASNGTTFMVGGIFGAGCKGFYSNDNGVTWTERTTFATVFPVFSAITALVYGGTQFVGVGNSGACGTSPSGTTWTAQAGLSAVWGTSNVPQDICWSGSLYMTAGDNGACATSPDGVTWTYRSALNGIFGTQQVTCVAFQNGKFFAAGLNGTFAVSTDSGATWTSVPAFTTAFTAVEVVDIYWTGKNYCVVGGQFNTGSAKVVTSLDGITWTAQTYGIASSIYASAYNGNGGIVATGFNAGTQTTGIF